MKIKISALVLLFLGTARGSPYSKTSELSEYDYDTVQENDNEIKDNYEQPQFVTLPQTLLVNEGDTIRLPCFVNRLEGFVMLWKRGKDIITVGNQIGQKCQIGTN